LQRRKRALARQLNRLHTQFLRTGLLAFGDARRFQLFKICISMMR
jgi:hypothetical protein